MREATGGDGGNGLRLAVPAGPPPLPADPDAVRALLALLDRMSAAAAAPPARRVLKLVEETDDR